MSKKTKLNLENLNVQSFKTTTEIKGGAIKVSSDPYCNSENTDCDSDYACTNVACYPTGKFCG